MSGRHVVIAVCCALASVASALTAPPVVARARSSAQTSALSVDYKAPPGMVAALQRDLRLTKGQAHTRLLNEIRLAGVEARLREQLGSRYGGSWLMGTIAQTLVVATTDPADTAQIVAAGARAEVVKRSLTELEQHLDDIEGTVSDSRNGVVRYVDARNNRVVVLSAEPLVVEDLIESSGLDSSVVRVAPSLERPRLFSGEARGGDAYYVGGTSRCSIGFAVTRGTQSGFVSAGHCGKRGEATTGANRTPQGVFEGSSFPGDDYAWVALNSNWTAKPLVSNGGGGTVPVTGSRVAIEGASVCRSGSTTDWHCGVIRQLNASVSYPQGVVSQVTRTSVCAEPGDSGGSFISVDQAQGVTSGGSGDCTTGGVTYFQPVNEILTAYGLTLVTEGDSPPDTAPPAAEPCAGSQVTRTGTLGSRRSAYQPDNRHYRTTATGPHEGCLNGDGADFDLFLQRWTGFAWVNVAVSDGPRAVENISYTGPAGYYRYRVSAASGSGTYTLRYKTL